MVFFDGSFGLYGVGVVVIWSRAVVKDTPMSKTSNCPPAPPLQRNQGHPETHGDDTANNVEWKIPSRVDMLSRCATFIHSIIDTRSNNAAA